MKASFLCLVSYPLSTSIISSDVYFVLKNCCSFNIEDNFHLSLYIYIQASSLSQSLCYAASCLQMTYIYTVNTFFPIKVNIIFRFLLISKNRYQCRSFVKMKWHKTNFQKVEDTLHFLPFWPTIDFIGIFYFWIKGETCITYSAINLITM